MCNIATCVLHMCTPLHCTVLHCSLCAALCIVLHCSALWDCTTVLLCCSWAELRSRCSQWGSHGSSVFVTPGCPTHRVYQQQLYSPPNCTLFARNLSLKVRIWFLSLSPSYGHGHGAKQYQRGGVSNPRYLFGTIDDFILTTLLTAMLYSTILPHRHPTTLATLSKNIIHNR